MTADLHDDFLRHLEPHKAMLHRLAGSWTRQAEDRADLLQEMVLQAFRAFPGFDRVGRFSTFLYRIALNVAISHQRRERTRQRHTPLLDEVGEALAAAVPPEVERLRSLIAELPDLDRALVMLHLDGNDYASIAEVLGISASNVGTRLSRLKRRLERQLRQEDIKE